MDEGRRTKCIAEKPPKGVKRFLVEYPMPDGLYALEVPAEDFDDAKKRVEQLQYGVVLGEISMTIPNSAVARALLPTWCAIRNWFKGC
jgi:hypothetical protein